MRCLSSPKLEVVQRWMQAFIVDPGTDLEAQEAAGQSAGLSADGARQLFRPSNTLEPFERIMIYRDQYLMRMLEALAGDYPVLHGFLGEQRFLALVTDYVQVYPSRSYTLNRLGGHFPEFVGQCGWLPRRRVLAELARLELALCQVFDEVETRPIGPADIEGRPADSWNRARLIPIAALRLLELSYPVSDLLDAPASPRAPLRRKDSWVVVYRRDFEMYRLALTRPAYVLLRELLAERPLEEALDSALRQARG